jgi:hypothetical protein
VTFAKARGRKIHSRGARILLALFITFGSVVFATAATSGAAWAASGCTATLDDGDYVISQSVTCYGLQVVHECVTIGSTSNTSAVECSDVYANTDSGNDTAQLWGNGEYYCQGTYSQCEGMNVKNTFSLNSNSSSASFTCNDTSSLCPNGSRQNVGTAKVQVSEVNQYFPVDTPVCYSVTASDPAGNVIAVYGASSAFHASSAETTAIEVCFSPSL